MAPQALSPGHAAAWLVALWRSRDASMTTTLALVLVPVLGVLGAGVDVTRAYTARIKFEAAFDNAAAALRASPATDSAAVLQARMQSYLDLANPSPAPGSHVTVRMSDPLQPVVMMTASAAMPTTVMQLAGVPSLKLHAAAQVVRQNPPGSQNTPHRGDDGRRPENGDLWQYGHRHGNWLREDWRN
ncbi:MAG TPA: pilus assembly protein TadG-related protein [Stellaceae bacterium]|nr:pilus assembly protein TadG-related protein [Stellaceae bacterium]